MIRREEVIFVVSTKCSESGSRLPDFVDKRSFRWYNCAYSKNKHTEKRVFMKTKKSIALLLAVLMFCGLFAACGQKEEGEIKIGFIGPLTGDVAMYGTTAQKLSLIHI